MKQVLNNERFIKALSDISVETGEDFEIVQSKAEKYLKELQSEQSPFASPISSRVIENIMGMAYEKTIDVNPS